MKDLFRRIIGKTGSKKTSSGNENPAADLAPRALELDALEPRVLFSGAPVVASAETEEPEIAQAPASGNEVGAGDGGNQQGQAGDPTGLTQEEVEIIAEAAKQRWIDSGISEAQLDALNSITYQIENLPGFVMGEYESGRITIDVDASGVGWYLDGAPTDDSEFQALDGSTTLYALNGGEAATGIDLLSLLVHEQGHVLGLTDSNSGAMLSDQGVGLRRLPVAGEAVGATPGSLEGVHRAAVTVTQLNDVVNGNTSSVAALIASNGGDGISLREAILAANNDAAADVITLAAGTHAVTGSAFTVTTQLSLEGAGVGTTIIDASGGAVERVFTITNSPAFALTDLTITGGGSTSVNGGALYIQDSNVTGLRVALTNNTGFGGGAVYFYGSTGAANTVSFTDSEFSGNYAQDYGGAIMTAGHDGSTVLLDRSLVAENRAAIHGGGIWNYNTYTAMTLRNSTVSGNSAGFLQNGTPYLGAAGGGIITGSDSTLFLDHTTVARNFSNGTNYIGGGIWNSGGLTTTNSIIADNRYGTNASGAGGLAGDIYNSGTGWVRAGANIVETHTGDAPTGTNHLTADPGLGALADNGGPTRTHAIGATSNAYNAAVSSTLTVDQRGAARPFAGVSDIGAFESGAVVAPPTPTTTTSVTYSSGNLVIEDTDGGNTNDDWTLSLNGGNLVFTDNNGNGSDLLGDLDGGAGDGTDSIEISPASLSSTYVKPINLASNAPTTGGSFANLTNGATDENYAAPSPGGGNESWYTANQASGGVNVTFDFASATDLGQLALWDYYAHSPENWRLRLYDGANGTGTELLSHDFSIVTNNGDSNSERHLIDFADVTGALSGILTPLTNAPAGGVGIAEIGFLSAPQLNTVTVNGSGGDDTLTIDLSGGTFTQNIVFNGGAGNDKLVITGGTFGTVTYDATDATDGVLDFGSFTVTFTGLEPVDLTGSSITDLAINVDPGHAVAGGHTTTIAQSGGTDTLVTVSGGFESVLFRGLTGTLTINGEDGENDTITVTGVGTSFAGNLSINGGTGNDTVSVTNAIDLGSGSLSITAESIELDAGISTTGDQTFSGATVIGADISLTASKATFTGTIDSVIGQNRSLTISGDAVLGDGSGADVIGGNDRLSSLSVSGTTEMNLGGNGQFGDDILTTGGQTFTGAVTIEQHTVLNNQTGTILFGSTLDGDGGAHYFKANSNGIVRLDGAIGGIQQFGYFETGGGGTTELYGGSISTSFYQTTFNSTVLGTDTVLTAGSFVHLREVNGIVAGAQSLTINGDASLGRGSGTTIGGTTALSSISVSGDTEFWSSAGGPHVITTGSQTYGAATLTTDTGLMAGDVFLGDVDLGVNTLTTTVSGAAGTVSGVISGTGGLIKSGGGTLTLGGANTYDGATNISLGTVVLGHNSALGSTVAGTTVSSGGALDFNGFTTSENLVLNGTGVGGTGALLNSGSAVFLSGTIQLATDTTIGTHNGVIQINGVISGGGQLTKVGTGFLALNNSGNDFTGDLIVDLGVLTVLNDSALGTTAGKTIVNGGQLRLQEENYSTTETLEFNGGSLRGSSAIGAFAGPITLNATTQVLVPGGRTLTLSGAISGTGGLTKTDGGTLTLTGDNLYGGVTTISAGILDVDGTHTGGGTYNVASGATLRGGGSIAADISGAGGSFIVSDGNLTLGKTNSFGGFHTDGTLTVSLGDTVTINDQNQATLGPVTVVNGTLTKGGGAAGFWLGANETLSGSGTINGNLTTNSGTIAPGNSPGVLTINGNLNLSGGTLSAEVNGGSPGTQYDQIDVTGTVTLTGATLSTSGTIISAPGQELILIDNDDSDAITGTFAGLAESDAVVINGVTFYLSYVGNDGNDLTLTEAGPASFTSDGLGAGALEVRLSGTSIEFVDDGVVIDSRPLAALTGQTLTIDGTNGADETLTINYSGGVFDVDIVWNGGVGGADNDGLIVTGGTFDTVTHTFTSGGPENSGNITYDDGVATPTISYTGLEPVDMTGSTIADLVFNLPGTADQGILEDDGIAGNGISRIRSVAGTFETTTFATPTGSVRVNLGGDGASFVVDSLDSTFNAGLTIDGQGGADAVAFQGSNTLLASLTVLNTAGTSVTVTDSAGTNLQVAGQASFSLGSGSITLGDNGGDTLHFGSLEVIASGNAIITEDSGTDFSGASNIGGNLTLISAGDITDSGTLQVDGTTRLTAGANDIVLDGANDFADSSPNGLAIISANHATINDVDGLRLTHTVNSSVTGNLILTTGGDISQGARFIVGGTTSVDAGGGFVSLNAGNNDFQGAVSVSNASGLSISDTNALLFDNVNVAGTVNGNIIAGNSGVGGITQTVGGSVIIGNGGGSAFLTAGTAVTPTDIVLANAGNDFGSVGIQRANDVTLNDSNAIQFTNSTVSDQLTVTANGNITQSGSMTITGIADFTATGGAITLGSGGNDFQDQLILTNTGANDVTIWDNNDLHLGDVSVGQNLNLSSSTGELTQEAGTSVVVPGIASFNFTPGVDQNITLTNATNDFGGVRVVNGEDVQITDANAIVIVGNTNVNGDLTVIAGGDITDNGLVRVLNGIAFFNAGTNDITLGGAGETTEFQSLRFIGDNVTIQEDGAMTIGGAGSSSASGNLVLSSGTIGQTQALTVTGTSNLTATGGDLTLDNVANDFGGAITATAGGAGDMTLVDDNDIIIASLTAVGDTINVTSINGSILDGGSTPDVLAASVNYTGNVAPGLSPGILLVNGNFTLTDDSSLNSEIGGTTPGTGLNNHDQVDVTGSVSIGNNVDLNLISFNGFVPTAGQTFTLVVNDGADAIVGTFTNPETGTALLEGYALDMGDQVFTISYTGGTGNDVVLTAHGLAETNLTLDVNGNLVLTDINGNSSDDQLSFTMVGANLVITDPNLNLTSDIAGSWRPNEHTVVIPVTAFNELIVTTGNGDDTLTVNDLTGFTDSMSFDGEGESDTITVNGDYSGSGADVVFTAETVTINTNANVATDGAGTITVNAGRNVAMEVGSSLSTVDGDIDVTASGVTALPETYIGLEMVGAEIISTTGDITINATGGNRLNNNIGVSLDFHASTGTTSTISTGGSVSIDGTSRGTSTQNEGVRIYRNSVVESTGAGTVSIDGTGGTGTRSNPGVLIASNSEVRVNTGDLSITGDGGSAQYSRGIQILVSTIESTGGGDISILGVGSGSTIYGIGTEIVAADIFNVAGGSISIIGNGSSGSSLEEGLKIGSRTEIRTVDGNIILTGNGGPGAGNRHHGVSLLTSDVESTGSGDIIVTGSGGAFGRYTEGVQLVSSTITSNTGDIAVTGTSGGIGNFNDGITLGSSTIQSTGGGDLTFSGQGRGTSGYDIGFAMSNTDLSTTSGGTITIRGTGGLGGSGNMGVKIGSGSTISAVDGEVLLEGTGQGTANMAHGVAFSANTRIDLSGSGDLTIRGTGGAGGVGGHSLNYGVEVSSTTLTVADGDLTIQGTSGGRVSFNKGLNLINSTFRSTGAGDITFRGTGSGTPGSGSLNQGISASKITVAADGTGDISLTGTSGNGKTFNHGMQIGSLSSLTTNSGSIELTGSGRGTESMNKGVILTSTSTISAGNSGTITILGTGSQIGVGATTTSINDGVEIGLNSSVTSVDGNIDIRGTGGGRTSMNRGVNLYLATIRTTGGGAINVAGTGSQLAIGNFNHGIYAISSTIESGGAITMVGTGGRGEHFNDGVYISSASTISAAGILDLRGTAHASSTGLFNSGVYVFLNSTVNGAGGSSIAGTGGGGTGFNHGVDMRSGITSNVGTITGSVTDGNASSKELNGDFAFP